MYGVGDLWVAYFQSINCFIGLWVFWFSSHLSGLIWSMIKGAKYLCVNMLPTNCQFLHKIHLSQQGLLSDKSSKPPPLQKTSLSWPWIRKQRKTQWQEIHYWGRKKSQFKVNKSKCKPCSYFNLFFLALHFGIRTEESEEKESYSTCKHITGSQWLIGYSYSSRI